jgi:cytochrome c553
MKKILIAGAIILSGMISTSVFAADAAAGKTKAAVCAGCHGADGHSVNPMWPSLAGQQGMYLEKQIKAFRDGTRKDPTMSPMAAGLTDEDVANIAAYFAGLK